MNGQEEVKSNIEELGIVLFNDCGVELGYERIE